MNDRHRLPFLYVVAAKQADAILSYFLGNTEGKTYGCE
jgi:hypothetical protein